MSYEELDRVGVIERVIEKRLTQLEAARMLGVTSRQVRRLRDAYVSDGALGLASKHRGVVRAIGACPRRCAGKRWRWPGRATRASV
ncbi:MAG: helix-turn-helix domain-containing protein, partial [Myxococcota bacterium]